MTPDNKYAQTTAAIDDIATKSVAIAERLAKAAGTVETLETRVAEIQAKLDELGAREAEAMRSRRNG